MNTGCTRPTITVGGVPVELIRTVPGLMRVVEYLDAIRGRVVSDIWAACSARAPRTRSAARALSAGRKPGADCDQFARANARRAGLLEDLHRVVASPRCRTGGADSHYLLATPFRYPPLPYGSRFGSRFEPSLFYGARSASTALAESAYYRFVFWSGMATPPPAPLTYATQTVPRQGRDRARVCGCKPRRSTSSPPR